MRRQASDIVGQFVNQEITDVNKSLGAKNNLFMRYMQNSSNHVTKKKKNDNKRCVGPLQLRERYLFIDSRDRNSDLHPFSSNYSIDVSKETLANVVKIEMVASNFIKTQQGDFLIMSNALGSDFRLSSNVSSKALGLVQMPGDIGDTVYNSYVGCKKVYYDNSIVEELGVLDFSFIFPNGTLIDFGEEEHTFVLKVTELIKKVEKSEFSTRIGHTFNY